MQKKIITSYLLIFLALLTIMSLSRHTSEKMREHSVALLAPLWEKFLSIKYFVFHPFQPSPFSHLSLEEEKDSLLVENQLMRTEISYLQKQLNEYMIVSSELKQMARLAPQEILAMGKDYEKSFQRNLKLIKQRMQAIPARVIFRSFDTWNSFLWINIGESTNQNSEIKVVGLNSPVVVGKAIVGVIDYVGKDQSRVRLISDNRLTPSVRASRGGEQDFLLREQIESVLQQMRQKKEQELSSEDQTLFSKVLQKTQQRLNPLKKTWFLAKGELAGSSFSARLGQNILLKGTGFNYDFRDEEGESRDLRNGKSTNKTEAQGIPILKIDDILITTGMDGIFPPGFQVAIVTQVKLLKEGDYFYEIEAKPIAGPLEELSVVFVLPPLTQENF